MTPTPGQKWPWVKRDDGKFSPEPPYRLGDSVPCESNEFHQHMKADPRIVAAQWAQNYCKECGDEYEAYMQRMEDES